MKVRKTETGFSIVEGLIIAAVVAVVGFSGYTFLNASNAKRVNVPASPKASQQAENRSIPAAPAIENTSDLDKASKVLDSVDVSTDGDAQKLETETNQL